MKRSRLKFSQLLLGGFLSCLLCLGLVSGCESDPVLAPDTADEEPKGSYGFSTFSKSFVENDSPEIAPLKRNPEVF